MEVFFGTKLSYFLERMLQSIKNDTLEDQRTFLLVGDGTRTQRNHVGWQGGSEGARGPAQLGLGWR